MHYREECLTADTRTAAEAAGWNLWRLMKWFLGTCLYG